MENSKKLKSGMTLITTYGQTVEGATLVLSLEDARGILEMTSMAFMRDIDTEYDERNERRDKVLYTSTQFLRGIAKKILSTSGKTTNVESLIKNFN